MVLTLRRSAYSTNIKTRSDFSCAFFDAELRAVAQGFTQPVHLGSMVEQVPQAIRSYGPENLGPGDVIITNEPFPSGVHLNDVSLDLAGVRRRRAARLRRQPRPPRRRRRRRARLDRRLPRGVPGGRDHPARQGGRGRPDRRRRLRADPGADPLQARDGGRLPRPDRGERDGSAAARGARRAATATRRSWPRWRSCSTTPSGARGPSSPRCRTASTSRRARSTPTATPTSRCASARGSRSARRRLVRPRGQRPAAARAGQLHLRADLLGVRLRAQVPDRPRPAGQRRLLPARAPRRAARQRHELHLALARRRRLGDADPARRHHLPRDPAGAAGVAPGRDEGDDVPRRASAASTRSRTSTSASSRPSAAATAGGSRATARTPCRRTARTPRTRPSRRRS